MAFQRELLEQWWMGSNLAVPLDQIPPGGVRVLQNARFDRAEFLGLISARPGSVARRDSAIAASVVRSLHRRYATGNDTAYAHVGTTLYRLDDTWEGTTSIATDISTTPISSAAMVDGDGNLIIYFANGDAQGLIKDDGSGATAFGVPPPTAAPSAVALATDMTTTIDVMDATAQFTATNLGGLANDTTVKQQGTGSVTFTVAASTLGDLADGLGGTLNLDTLTGGNIDVKGDDYIHLWVRVDFPERLQYLQIEFDLDTATLANAFSDNYYSVRLESLAVLNQGADQWTRVQVPKSEFQRFGTDTAKDWNDVIAHRLRFLTNDLGAITVWLDDFKLRGGTDLVGEVEYTAIYRNSTTKGKGNPPKDADDLVLWTDKITVDRQRVNVTITNVIQGGANHPGDTQIDRIRIYRRIDGGEALFIADIADTASSPYLDEVLIEQALLLADSLETDNDVPPTDGVYLFGPGGHNRLFLIIPPNELAFSKAWESDENRAENWPENYRARAGDDSEELMSGSVTGGLILLRTKRLTMEVVGQGADTYIPVAIPHSRGQVGRFASTHGDGREFFVSQDGIYEQVGGRQTRLTDSILPFFGGLTVDGVLGWNTSESALEDVRLQWCPSQMQPFLLMLYPEAGSDTLNKELVLKKNPRTGQYTEVCFDSREDFTLRSLYLDVEENVIIAGDSVGQLYQLNSEALDSDNGSAIDVAVKFGASHQGTPHRDKCYGEVLIEANTGGGTITATARYNKAAIDEILGTFTTTAHVADSQLPVSDPTAFYQDIAYTLESSTTTGLVIARIGVTYETQPELLTYWDSGKVAMGLVTQIKDLWYDIQTLGTTIATLYLDGHEGREHTVLTTDGREQFAQDLPAGMKGRILRLTLAGSAGFRLYQVQAQGKPLGSIQGYAAIPLGRVA